ncbi:MAG TPA: M3 family metallopeptidase [Candidatus Acidoferrum sp.]|nr:M3 family metallopeptidase [Candidatus Acidoferrum sp.]
MIRTREDEIHREMGGLAKREIVWDLSEMFPSMTDPSVEKAIDDLTKMAQSFASRYHGKIKDLSAKELLQCIKNFEEYYGKLDSLATFSYLSYVANMTLPDAQLLNDKVNKIKARLNKMLAFFNIEVGSLTIKSPEIIKDPILLNYRHLLDKLAREVPHQLSEAEEKLVIEKDQFGIRAWEELQGKWLNTRTFEVEVEGKRKTLSFGEAYGLTYNPDRRTRESATKSIYGLLEKDGEIFSSALRNICNDWLNVCDTRKYDSPMEASLIANDIDKKTINNLLRTVENHNGIYQRYLKLKAKIMNLPKLCGHDIIAPISDAPDVKFDHETAKRLVIEAYSRFDEDYTFAVKDMFAKNHLDSTPRLGKGNGAFCADWYEGKSAYILNNFNDALVDVYTLAHELGHATHSYYYERSQTILNSGISSFPMIVAETASIFGELLLTDLLQNRTESNQERKTILCRVLDGASVIFRSTIWALFEQSVYDTIKQGECLDYKTICKCLVAARNKINGDAIVYSDEEEARWTSVPHNYMPNFRFYNYPYVYAQLFVYALYQKHLEEGKEFVPKFKKALSAGCSISPVEIGKIFGLDVTDAHFWELGIKQYEHFIGELEKIVS